MPDDSDNLTIYRNDKDGNILRVALLEKGVTLTTTGGANINQTEYDQIASFVSGHAGTDAFLAKVTARMGR